MATHESQPAQIPQLFTDLSGVFDYGLRTGGDRLQVSIRNQQIISAFFSEEDDEGGESLIRVSDQHTPVSRAYYESPIYKGDLARRWHALKNEGAFFAIQRVLGGGERPSNVHLLFRPSTISNMEVPNTAGYQQWYELARMTGEVTDGNQPVLVSCPVEHVTVDGEISSQLLVAEAALVPRLMPGSLVHKLALAVTELRSKAA